MSVKYAYGYIRVSTHDQEEISPDSQEHLLRDYAAKNNIVILKIFTDLGISGRKANKRPGFQEMIGLAKGDDHPVDQILVWKFSRFARNQEESIVYKSLLKKQHNVDVVSVSEPLSDNPFGSLIERIIEWMDEYYSIRLSGEVHRGMKENALRGAYQARPPLGYKVVEHGKPPVIVPEEAKIVRTIFEKYTNEGMSFFDIARYLNSLGLKTSHGKPFERRSVEYIIQNPSYCGMIRWNRTENSTNRIKDKDEWIVTEGQQPAIISKELFESAQERFKATYKQVGKRPSSTYKHWLSGLLKCPDCGRTLTSATMKRVNGEKYSYFSCYGYSKGKCKKPNGISSLVLEKEVLTSIKEILDTKDIVYELREYQPTEQFDERKAITEQLESLTGKEERIKASYREGIDTLEEYKANKAIIQKERESLEQQLKELKKAAHKSDQDPADAMLQKVRSVYDILISNNYTYIQKNEALKQIIDKIIYDRKNDSLKIYFFLYR
ncbi:recombinase family protein [Dorea longicatena]|jgi:DNA invertase Pin-like site-specific DNA recombinase|uniref:Recombinase family protein n=1 Tax=Dorea longicatena TaxID=88431 RepID=A0AAP7AQ01_9FIRM|nr:recombinase family protein [Dorea longicatena]NSE48799.1 recombinase family protein [Dorea longicatena]NSE56714.1 recombinase family protein [Dorea longicatena]DAK64174.1 MAG TPA: integrase [Caudoviricetes sp.]